MKGYGELEGTQHATHFHPRRAHHSSHTRQNYFFVGEGKEAAMRRECLPKEKLSHKFPNLRCPLPRDSLTVYCDVLEGKLTRHGSKYFAR